MSKPIDDRKRGILTPSDRKYLRGCVEYADENAAYNTRKRIRQRVFDSLLDFSLLFEQMEESDVQHVFMTSTSEEEALLRSGLTHAIAFIYYAGFGFHPPFEGLLKSGVSIAENKLAEPGTRDVSVTFEVESTQRVFTEATVDSLIQKIEQGRERELTPAELTGFVRYLAQSDEFSPELARKRFQAVTDDLREEQTEGEAQAAERKRKMQQDRREHVEELRESGEYGIKSRVRQYAQANDLEYIEASKELLAAGLDAVNEGEGHN